MSRTKKLASILAALVLLICLVVVAGCGNGDTPPADPTPAPSNDAPPAAGDDAGDNADNADNAANDELKGLTQAAFDELTDIIKTAQNQPQFEAAGEPFDIRAAVEGKTILTIPMSTSNPFPMGIADMLDKLGDELGVDVRIWENQGEISEWIQGVENAVLMGADVVDLSGGSNPNSMGAQIEDLISKGIYVQSSHFSDVSQEVEYVSANCGAPYAVGGKLLADWAILKGGADVNILVITSDEVPSAEAMVNAIETEFAKYAPDAKRTYVNVPVNEWAAKIQTEVLTAVQRDPDLDYVVPIYDPMCQYVVPALEMATMEDKVKVIAFNGTPFVIDYVREGKVEITIGENLDWIAHAAMDTAGRMLAGLEIPKDTKIPLYIWSAENAEEAGVPAEYSTGYGDVYIEGYNQMWMINE